MRNLHLRRVHTSALKSQPYQETRIESCLDAVKDGSTKIGVSLPIGAGKSVVFVSSETAATVFPRNSQATRSTGGGLRTETLRPLDSKNRTRSAVHCF